MALTVALVTGFAVWFWPTAAPRLDPSTVPAVNQHSAGEGRAEPGVREPDVAPVRATVVVQVAPDAEPAVDPGATKERLSQVSLDLCGVGPVSIRQPPPGAPTESFELLPSPLGQHARAEAWPRVLATLEASPVDRSRAAALVLRASGLLEAEASPLTLTQQRPDTAPFVRQLATLARATRDAGVLQWALSVCEREPGLAECQALSARELVALAPDDGRSWLLLAAADPGRRDEALRRAASAAAIGSLPSLSPAVEAAAPAGLPPYLLLELLVQAVGVEAALVDSALFSALAHCRTARHEQRATCAALADALHLRGENLLTLSVARSMGERQGWPAARVAAVKAEVARLTAQFPELGSEQPYACAAVERTRDWLRDRANLGERAALQRRAAATPTAATR